MTAPKRQQYLQRLLEEKKRREREASPTGSLADEAFPVQRAFIEDQSPRKAAICSRRAGKSYAIGLLLFMEALANPGCSCLYLGEKFSQVKMSMFRQVMAKINRDHALGAVFNEAELSVKLPNGSIIYLQGVDTTMQQQEGIRGWHGRLIVVDEAGSFRNDLKTFVEETLEPAVLDDMGTICLIGTPRGIKNLFYDVTERGEPGWSVHRWHVRDNPAMAKQMLAYEVREKALNPNYKKTNKWRQEFEGEWVIDEGSMVYNFNEQRNLATELPKDEQWLHVIGMDLGYNDANAWVVCAYNLHEHMLYVREVKKQGGLNLDPILSFTKHLYDTYNPHAIVIDGTNKLVVEELKHRSDLPFDRADQQGKYEASQMLNSDLVSGRIKLLPGTEDLSKEWGQLAWDEKALKRDAQGVARGRYTEDPRCDNHLSDAMLYAWRRCRNYAPQSKVSVPKPGSEEALDAWWDDQGRRLEEEQRSEDWERW